MTRWTPSLLLAASLALAPLAMQEAAAEPAAHTSISSLTTALKDHYAGIDSLSASITQVSKGAMGETTMTGTVAVAKPGKARWELKGGGFETLMVFDGGTGWVYTPASNQVIKLNNTGGQAVDPLELFKTLDERFETTLDSSAPADRYLVQAKPKAGTPLASQYKVVQLSLSRADYAPLQIVLTDAMGGTTELSFSETKANPTLDAGLFQFTPPAGVQVVDGSL